MTAPSKEDSLIARYFRPLATDRGARGLVDDAAVLAASNDDLVITTDAIVEGVHFLPDDPPDTIARKALRVNLSDLAAKGATPAGFVLTVALREVRDEFLRSFARALGEDAEHFKCPLLGGDTVSTPGPLMISITAFGRVPPDKMVGRTGAQPGDRIFVSGSIGDAALGLDMLTEIVATRDAELIARYRVPQPRVALAQAVRDFANAAMDVSDGLAGDLAKLCTASGVSADVEWEHVPLSAPARALIDNKTATIARLIGGGDDYEILCTVPSPSATAFREAAQVAGVAVTDIGVIEAGSGVPRFIGDDGQPIELESLSFSHF